MGTNYKSLLDQSTFVSWLESISISDEDKEIRLSAKQIAYAAKGNGIVPISPMYNKLYAKYKFKVISKLTSSGFKLNLYLYTKVLPKSKNNFIFSGETYVGTVSNTQNTAIVPLIALKPAPSAFPIPQVTPSITPSVTPSVSVTPSITPSFTPSATPTITPPFVYQDIGTPEMYGAVGDGVTDDYLAIKRVFVSHSVIQFDAKTYAVRGYIGVPSYRTIVGSGVDRTIIKLIDNSPYGYGEQVSVFNNTMFQDDVDWVNTSSLNTVGGPDGEILGSGSVNYFSFGAVTDVFIVDESPNSPLYKKPQTTDWAGLGYFTYQGVNGLRRDILIKDLTIDCNFNNQARHITYNWNGNPKHSTNSYIPQLSWKVRTTTSAITLCGENIRYENVKAINYGYGVPHLNTVGPINWGSSNSNIPSYVECFVLSINGSNTELTFEDEKYSDNTN